MPIQLTVLYVIGCFLAGYLGRNRRIGFWGFVFASFIFTPLISILFIYLATPQPPPGTTQE